MTVIQPAAVVAMAESLLRYPQATVCVHYVVAGLLDLLDKSGVPITAELAEAVVQADDENGLRLLHDLGKTL